MGLPMPNGKLAMWLFLVTEIMFFTALIGTYIVLRQSAPHRGGESLWPAPHEVHLVEWAGAVNTFVLICSSLTVVLAHWALGKGDVRKATMLHRRHPRPGHRVPRHQGVRVQREVRPRHPARPSSATTSIRSCRPIPTASPTSTRTAIKAQLAHIVEHPEAAAPVARLGGVQGSARRWPTSSR